MSEPLTSAGLDLEAIRNMGDDHGRSLLWTTEVDALIARVEELERRPTDWLALERAEKDVDVLLARIAQQQSTIEDQKQAVFQMQHTVDAMKVQIAELSGLLREALTWLPSTASVSSPRDRVVGELLDRIDAALSERPQPPRAPSQLPHVKRPMNKIKKP